MCININKNKKGTQVVGDDNEVYQEKENLLIEVKKIVRKSSMFWGFVSGVVASLIANCVFEWWLK